MCPESFTCALIGRMKHPVDSALVQRVPLQPVQACTVTCRETHDHPKALYRRAMAHSSLGDYDQAEHDLLKWKEVEPSAAAEADMHLHRVRERRKAANVKQKQQFKSFFDRT